MNSVCCTASFLICLGAAVYFSEPIALILLPIGLQLTIVAYRLKEADYQSTKTNIENERKITQEVFFKHANKLMLRPDVLRMLVDLSCTKEMKNVLCQQTRAYAQENTKESKDLTINLQTKKNVLFMEENLVKLLQSTGILCDLVYQLDENIQKEAVKVLRYRAYVLEYYNEAFRALKREAK